MSTLSSNPVKAKDLTEQWNAWAKRTKVYPKSKGASVAESLPKPTASQGSSLQHYRRGRTLETKGSSDIPWQSAIWVCLVFHQGTFQFLLSQRRSMTELVAKQSVKGLVTWSASLNDEKLLLSVNGKEVVRSNSLGLLVGQPPIGMYSAKISRIPSGNTSCPTNSTARYTGSSQMRQGS
tara:strand:+ start:616 stop:1152 length:537 start_codon:yes stop_codon:yes gene_type:complete